MIKKAFSTLHMFAPAMSISLIAGCSAPTGEFPDDGSPGGINYVSVRNEPQHRHQFENERIRIYDVLLPTGHVTLYHSHTLDTVYAVIDGSELKTTTIADESAPVTFPLVSGMVSWSEHQKKPLIHQVANVGENIARLIGVEIKNETQPFAGQPLSGNGLTLRETYTKVRVYELSLAAGESTGSFGASGFTGLIVGLTSASLSVVTTNEGSPTPDTFKPASWKWLEERGQISINNVGDSPFKALLYELP